ncbi:hypothetical protein DOTSEDRAFT_71015 [Dothistroma septosporum NZE10]|uniref:Stress-response A/B barrel domain-containing protein n=1 Tax=Dothistroma septosporum (strain NZE10 / CBS 128990) TaxID=675120 RepID=N1PRW9_DOTSN|nr:hypothetical protein DOTSEDRAFT_71015 [Dothistroma septosporum NZE10]
MTTVRVTAFKVTNDADIDTMLDAYKLLAKENQKHGQRYILDVKAFREIGAQYNQGYNCVAVTQFQSAEDMKFYDEECPAHKKLKETGKGKVGPPLILFGES